MKRKFWTGMSMWHVTLVSTWHVTLVSTWHVTSQVLTVPFVLLLLCIIYEIGNASTKFWAHSITSIHPTSAHVLAAVKC